MFFRVSPEIFSDYPGALVGVVLARGIDNAGQAAAAVPLLREAEGKLAERLGSRPVAEHPHIAPWREAYRKFGAKPKDHPSSVESLVRRVLRGHSIPHVNKLVDLYNAISLKYLLPAGGEDLDAIEGDLVLTIATDKEASVRLLGEPGERPPHKGEVIYKDDIGPVCRRWNWKEADRTKLTERTRNAVLVIEGLPPIERGSVEQAVEELRRLTEKHCGGAAVGALLDAARARLDPTGAVRPRPDAG